MDLKDCVFFVKAMNKFFSEEKILKRYLHRRSGDPFFVKEKSLFLWRKACRTSFQGRRTERRFFYKIPGGLFFINEPRSGPKDLQRKRPQRTFSHKTPESPFFVKDPKNIRINIYFPFA